MSALVRNRPRPDAAAGGDELARGTAEPGPETAGNPSPWGRYHSQTAGSSGIQMESGRTTPSLGV